MKAADIKTNFEFPIALISGVNTNINLNYVRQLNVNTMTDKSWVGCSILKNLFFCKIMALIAFLHGIDICYQFY